MGKKSYSVWIALMMIFTVFFQYHPSASYAAVSSSAVVKADILNVRSSPNTKASIVAKLKQNEKVEVVAKSSSWSQIQFNKKKGWVATQYLKANEQVGYITATSLNIRNQASEKGKLLGSVKKNAKVTILSISGTWYYIQTESKIKGWVSNKYVTTTPPKGTSTKPPVTKPPVVNIKTLYVKASSLNVRSEPSMNGEILGKLLTNDEVKASEVKGNWTKVSKDKLVGWVASQYLSSEKLGGSIEEPSPETPVEEMVVLIDNANIRSGPGTQYPQVILGLKGETFKTIGFEEDWFKILLKDGTEAWVASWLIMPVVSKPDSGGLEGKTIVLDAGHGGRDPGAVGLLYYEKNLTLTTVMKTADLLRSAGANVVLTRSDDTYLTLQKRVDVSHKSNTDVFVSFHYNVATKTSSGIMSFYYTASKEKSLAETIQKSLIEHTGMKDQGVRYGNFHVIRENKKPAVLLELGFVSNPTEEQTLGTEEYQAKAAQGVFDGLVKYFNSK
ncbi:SH3 domain-containing protein [Peribacillus alkalitolerans]|uniref:SH3 domain-containing protein n=1 Tax=Peribacillus alkalitolerans TaxID=1550385 RepID=UPI0013D1D314|nr:SH3 domain-containing protein [Peribacillus alkalitolerans]